MSKAVLDRKQSKFAHDIETNKNKLEHAIQGRELLIIGAAGSIGQAFVKLVSLYRPERLVLLDINENTLVEVVRDLRSSNIFPLPDLVTYSIDFSNVEFRRFLDDPPPHSHFINFAAMKHVRSERDPFSLMRMIDVNVRALHQYLEQAEKHEVERVFSVSTDKVIRPTSLMGATKNLMEKTLFSWANRFHTSTARFANVAFSDGSILQGFQYRLIKNQPIAAPNNIKRYFISHEEAGQLCLLAAFLGENRAAFFPRFEEDALTNLTEVATRFLSFHDLEPLICETEEEAKAAIGNTPGKWPCYFTPANTTGEKLFEEFHRENDKLDFLGYSMVGRVIEAQGDIHLIEKFLKEISQIKATKKWQKLDIVSALNRAVPELNHVELGTNLDQKM